MKAEHRQRAELNRSSSLHDISATVKDQSRSNVPVNSARDSHIKLANDSHINPARDSHSEVKQHVNNDGADSVHLRHLRQRRRATLDVTASRQLPRMLSHFLS